MTLTRYLSILAVSAFVGFGLTKALDAELRDRREHSAAEDAARRCARIAQTESDFRWCYEARDLDAPRWRP